jgi:2-oxoglutarate/2-oxoacid ferredoxin oxidoreductase subunit alpha
MPLAPARGEVRIRIGGPAGMGIKAAGATLARVFSRSGYHTFDVTEYPSLIKGGHNTYHLRVSEAPIFSHVMPTDVLVALDASTIPLHAAELTEGAAVIYDPADLKGEAPGIEGREDVCLTPVPFKDIVYGAGGQLIMRNTASLGAVLGHLGYPIEPLLDSLRAQFAHKAPEIAEQNVAVAQRGYDVAKGMACHFPYKMEPLQDQPRRLLLDGNEAIGLGALAAGIGLYCAYPMTPASSLLHFMAQQGETQGIVVKHTEDEIAAMNMVVGGAFGGTRSMCATSGGGFSLMVEALGLAGVSESAVVVGLFTRPGPATGLPTWTEQSDLRFAIHAAQGEFPRVVLAPGDHAQAFDLTWKAFNLADQLQTPVIVLGDSYLSDNKQTVQEPDVAAVTIDRGKIVTEGEVPQGYNRYDLDTDDGVSLRALPGVRNALQLANSYEHDERGWAAEDAGMRTQQNEKRLSKMRLAEKLVPKPIRFGPEEADLSIVCFGTTIMPLRQAIDWLGTEGIAVSVLQIVTVWPFPTGEVSRFLDGAKRTLVIEGNATGQLEGIIREQCLRGLDERLHRYDGRPFSPEQIHRTVRSILGLPEKQPPYGCEGAGAIAIVGSEV